MSKATSTPTHPLESWIFQMNMRTIAKQQRAAGFTLIELVMVLVILTALAALVVPIVDYIRRTSDKSSASFAMKQIVENLGMYRTSTGKYPSKLDSLMEGDGSATSTTELSTHRLGSKVTPALLTAGELNRMDDMFTTVMQHDTTNAYRNFQGNSGVNEIPANTQATYLTVVSNDIIDSIYPNASVNAAGVYPNLAESGLDTGQVALGANPDGSFQTARIIALGVGPANEAVGRTMQAAPAYAAVNGLEDYNRFIALFAVYDGYTVTKRPQLKGALDSTGDFLDQELIEVAENTLE